MAFDSGERVKENDEMITLVNVSNILTLLQIKITLIAIQLVRVGLITSIST